MSKVVLLGLLLIFGCSQKPEPGTTAGLFGERHRPQFHFSPAQNWTNDPNGLVYYDGEYHIFYQFNPYGKTWGHMSWGHAVSPDMIHWKELPVAIPEYANPTGDSTMIFSGTVVVDENNSSGLCHGKDCLVAIYTSHVHSKGQGLAQHQSLAFSNDKGRTWERYTKNPVLDIGRRDFRDPKVFWYAPIRKWVMVVIIPDQHKARFYQSDHLTDWKLMGEFGPAGDTLKIWECPDLFEAAVENSPVRKWVFSLSGSHPQGPGFVGMQYFTGQFDGSSFRACSHPTQYVNYGKDFYAGIVFNHLPAGQSPVMIGWALNWTYAKETPTFPWRGAMSLPRTLSLRADGQDTILIQTPIDAVQSLRQTELSSSEPISGKALELVVEIEPGNSSEAGIKVLKSGDEETIIGYNTVSGELFIDRTHSGDITFHTDFPSIERVRLHPRGGKISLHIFIDHSIIEVFANDGVVSLTECVYPTKDDAVVETYAKDGDASFSVRAWTMKSIWN